MQTKDVIRPEPPVGKKSSGPEFDQFAEQYDEYHREGVTSSSLEQAYFAEYKVRDLARLVERFAIMPQAILDFGSGVGTSVAHFRRHFPGTLLTCADVSERSLALASTRYPGQEKYLLIGEDRIPCFDDSFDVVFSACVFHHIPGEMHRHWLEELRRVVRPGGLLVVFEHNPWNPFTRRIVRNCPLDRNAVLIPAPALSDRIEDAGWEKLERAYRLFFPRALAALRPFEAGLRRIAIGAQYYVAARNLKMPK